MDERTTRRRFLRHSGATCGAGIVASTAGCLDGIPFLGRSEAYTKWLPAGDEFTGRLPDLVLSRPSALAQHEDAFEELELGLETYVGADQVSGEVGWTVDYDDLEWVLGVGHDAHSTYPVTVYEAEYSRDDLVERLKTLNYEPAGTRNGFDLFARMAPKPADIEGRRPTLEEIEKAQIVALDGQAVVSAVWVTRTPWTPLEPVLDAKAGEVDRYLEDEDDVKALFDHVGSGDFVYASIHEPLTEDMTKMWGSFEDQVATGHEFTVQGETAELRTVFLFEDEGDVEMDAVEDFVGSIDSYEDPIDGGEPYDGNEFSTRQRGRAVILTGTQETSELRRRPFWV